MASAPLEMIVYDREGELLVRSLNFLGNATWKKQYAVLCRLRRCLYLFREYSLYERHLAELNAHENDYRSWSARLDLHHSSAYVCSGYFSRPHVFELCGPEGVTYLQADSELGLRQWLLSLSQAGVVLKSDEKPLLLWRVPHDPASLAPAPKCFLFTRTSSTLPAHDQARVSSWETLAASMSFNAASLMKRAAISSRTPQQLGAGEAAADVQGLLGSEFTSDPSYGKTGWLQKLGRSLFARLYSDPSASADPASPFFDQRAALERQTAAAVGSSYNRWLPRFYRTSEAASGRACLVAYADRDQTKASTQRKHTLQLFQARIFDLAAVRRKVEEELRAEEAAAATPAQRGRTMSLPSQQQQEEKIPDESPSVRRAREAAFARAVQARFVAHPLFPEPLPSFSPSGATDFALFTKSPSPRFFFFRATTRGEKERWVGVLKNLAADTELQDLGAELDGAASLRAPSAASPSQLHDGSAHASILDTPLAPDEREVHCCTRDFYAILGCPFEASTDLLTKKYREIQEATRAKFMPLLTAAKQAEIAAAASAAEAAAASGSAAPAVAGSPPQRRHLRSMTMLQEQDDEEMGQAGSKKVFSFKLSPKSAARKLTLKTKAMTARAEAEAAAALSSGAVVPPTPANGNAPSALSAGAGGGVQLTHAQLAHRLRYKLGELRAVWRILKDPVRRCQYDERREALGLGKLDGLAGRGERKNKHLALPGLRITLSSPQESPAHDLRLDMTHGAILASGSRDGLPSRTLSLEEQAAMIDLNAVLQKAAKSSRFVSPMPQPPSSATAATGSTTVTATDDKDLLFAKIVPHAKTRDSDTQQEEKYPSRSEQARPVPSSASVAAGSTVPASANASPNGANPSPAVSPEGSARALVTARVISDHFSPLPARESSPSASPRPGTQLDSASATGGASSGWTALTGSTATAVAALSGSAAGSRKGSGAGGGIHVTTGSAATTPMPTSTPNPVGSPLPLAVTPSQSFSSSAAAAAALTLPPRAPPLPALRFSQQSPDADMPCVWMPGDPFSVEWNTRWGAKLRAATPAAAATTTPSAAAAVGAGGEAAQQPRVKLELMRRKGTGWLSRTVVEHVVAASAPDTGKFSFTLPLTLTPRRGYFLRLTLLPAAGAAAAPPLSPTAAGSFVTDSPTFEVVPLQKHEHYSPEAQAEVEEKTHVAAHSGDK